MTNLKKIAIFTYSIYTMGGEQKIVTMIANELCKEYDVTIFTMDSSVGNSMYNLSERVHVDFFHPYSQDVVSVITRGMVHVLPWLAYDVFSNTIKRAYCHKEYVRKMYELIGDSYDAVIATAWQLSILLGMVRQKYGLKCNTIGWMHNSYEAYFETKYLYLYKNEKLYVDYVSLLDRVVVLNERYAEDHKNKMGIQCDVIYNPKGLCSNKKSDLKSKNFIACGRFAEQKGFDLLLQAFSIFTKENDEWNLSIVGDGPLMKKYKKLIEGYNILDRVKLWGKLDDVVPPLLESSIYVLSSRYEGFPTCVTEAYEMGLPVVAFDIPAMIPLSRNGEAILVKSYDVEELAEQMLNLANDDLRRVEMGRKALTMAESLDINQIVARWKEIL